MLALGAQLGPYQIRAPLGAGGMGEVYRAKDSRLDRDVAIKVLPPQFAQDGARLARFEREAKAVAALSHPNILAIHDYGSDQGQTFAVMELLEGETLRGRIAHGAMPWRRAVEIGVAIADGLAAAHAKGIVHRDLKPENIFLTADGRVKILDFGLARIEPLASPSGDTPTGSYHAAQTDAGTILGTAGYMSPEQVRGREVDGRSDIFSLGCVLYEMVSGERAFARDSAVETMTAILHDEPAELGDSGKNVPLELGRLIQHCLEKSPAARFHSAHDLAYALRAILSDPNAASSETMSRGAARQPRAYRILAMCVLLSVAAASAYWLVPWLRDESPTSQVSKPGQAFDSLAILPLANVTGDPKGEPLCEGLAEHVSGRLSQVRELKVRPITSTVHYRGQSVDAKTVGRELDVQAVVTGRLRQEGETLVIALELVDARDNSLVWSKRYTGNRQQILDLQDQLARDLAVKLGLRLTGEEQQRLTKRHTEDPEAYLLYREATYHLNKFTPEGLTNSIEYCQRSIEKDPNYASAYAALARCYLLLGSIHQGPRQTYPEARKHLVKALAIDDTQPDAHAVLATIYMFHDWDWDAAEREFKQAIELGPSIGLTRNLYGFCLAATGRLPEALNSIKRGQELDPLAAPRRNEVAMCYNWMRQYDQAIAEARKALELDANFLLAYGELGQALTQKGLYAEAIAELQNAPTVVQGHPKILGRLGYTYAMAGQRAEAQRVLKELKDPAKLRFGCAFAITMTHAALGENDQAFEWLQKACDERDPHVIWLKVDATLDNLRSDPRFDAILQHMGLAERTAAQGDQPIDTLAILPFDNQSPDPEAGYLGDDITYSLTDSLARVRELKVRPYSSAARFKVGSFDAQSAGRELQVQAVLRGSVQQRGTTVLIDVELIHVGEDRRIWGNRYQGKLAERLTLQQQIIQEVPEKLRLSLTSQDKQVLAKLPTQSLKAHELYTLGRLAWNRRNHADLQEAIEQFEQAIDLDPNYALAYAGLADCYAVLPNYSRVSPKLAAAKARDAALKALERDPTLAAPHCSLAQIQALYHWDFTGAERSFQLALERKPNYPTGRHWYGLFLSLMGRHDEAISQLQLAHQLDPDSLIIRSALGRTFYMARKFDAAEAQWRATLGQAPDFIPALDGLGAAYLQQKRYPEAIQVLRSAWEREKNFATVGAWLGYAYGISGDAPRAREVLQEIQELAKQAQVSPLELSVIHLGMGAREEALKLLEQGYREGDAAMIQIKVEPLFDNLRDEPRFQKLIADMKFPE